MPVQVDTKQFEDALNLYVSLSSKTAEEALNGKMKDLMFQAAHNTPKMESVTLAARGIEDVRALAVWRRRRQKGFPPFTRPMPFTTADVLHSMSSVRHPSKGYMRSAFAKAGYLFKSTPASKIRPPSRSIMKHKGTKAKAKPARINLLEAVTDLAWQAFGGRDASAKKAIVKAALDKAVRTVYLDMAQYIGRKMQEHAAKVSA